MQSYSIAAKALPLVFSPILIGFIFIYLAVATERRNEGEQERRKENDWFVRVCLQVFGFTGASNRTCRTLSIESTTILSVRLLIDLNARFDPLPSHSLSVKCCVDNWIAMQHNTLRFLKASSFNCVDLV